MISSSYLSRSDIMIVKRNKKMVGISDENLARLSQKDIDSFRMDCEWHCPLCGFRMTYVDSLDKFSEPYIHDLRCGNKIEKNGKKFVCKRKMSLKNNKRKTFDSIYFNEIFSRYQNWIIKESNSASNIDSPEEIYSELVSAFLKVVGMFARNDIFIQTSDKWFSSFFWVSIQNKIADLQKTASYRKRTPPVVCLVCNKEVGKITGKHLCSEGHNSIKMLAIQNIGEEIMVDSGEFDYFSEEEERSKRSLFLGSKYLLGIRDEEKREKLIREKSLEAYFLKYNHSIKNSVLSMDSPISEDEDSFSMHDVDNDNVIDGNKNIKAFDDLFFNQSIEIIVDMVYNSNSIRKKSIDNFFKNSTNNQKRKEIIKDVIRDKLSFIKLKNGDVDRSYRDVQEGFCLNLMKNIREDNKCRIRIQDLILEG